MWIYANGGEDELGSDGAVGARGEECATGTGGACTRLEAGAADIVMWGPLAGTVGGIWICGGSI